MKALLFQEDARYDRFIACPLLERIFAECGKRRVVWLSNSRPPTGFEHTVRILRNRLHQGNPMAGLWLFMADSDGKDRAKCFASLEDVAAAQGIHLLCCAAEPELEAWLLAGHKEKLRVTWKEAVAHPQLKEAIFEPFLKEHGDMQTVDGGRGRLMKETLRNYRGLLTSCPELASLEQRIKKLCARKVI
jgi:hypothetical protein